MCGRITLTTPRALVAEFGVSPAALDDAVPRWNIAPTQAALVVVDAHRGWPHGAVATRPPSVITAMRWGLIPSWAKRPSSALINARAETVMVKPAFRDAIRRRRCLVPVDGFFEWQQTDNGSRPYHISPDGGRLATFGGMWESWKTPNDTWLHSFAIVTVAAAPPISGLHDRMPLLLAAEHRAAWLDEKLPNELLHTMLSPSPLEGWQIREVSKRVNRPANDDASCLDPPNPDESVDKPSVRRRSAKKKTPSGQGSLW